MPRWVRWMLVGMGGGFLALGLFLATAAARWARAEAARLARLPVVTSLGDQPAGAEVILDGTVGPNPPVFRDFVAFAREELGVTEGNTGGSATWKPDGGQTPPLGLAGGGRLAGWYRVARGHTVWYDPATLGFDRRERAGSMRYHALVAGGRVTAVGTVDAEGLAAREVFGGPPEEFLAARRSGAGVLPWLGGLFVAAGLGLAAAGALIPVRRAVPHAR